MNDPCTRKIPVINSNTMKLIKVFSIISIISALLLYPAISVNGRIPVKPDFSTPVIFVHGIESIGGDTFYNMHEKFALYGFPAGMMSIPLMPRIKAGMFDADYAWYTLFSAARYDASHWQGNFINADALRDAISRAAPHPGEVVDLVGHSNGTAVILKLLAKYPGYSSRIRKVVFISGFADVSGADGFDNIVTDLHNCMPFDRLPRNIRYYALSSGADANMDYTDLAYGKPSGGNPPPFDNTIRFWRMDGGNGIIVKNRDIPGMDHQEILTCDESVSQVFEWITGTAPPVPGTASRVTIGGRIIIVKGCTQRGAGEGSVSLEYYDPSTGLETGSAGSSAISREGGYSISSVSTGSYLKMTVNANGGTGVYFFADRIMSSSRALDFYAPEPVTSDNEDGNVSVSVMCRYSYLGPAGYSQADQGLYSGSIAAGGCTVMAQDSTGLGGLMLSVYLSLNLKNYGITAGNNYNFDYLHLNKYASKDVYVTSELHGRGFKNIIRINGSDRINNIENHVVYLYRAHRKK